MGTDFKVSGSVQLMPIFWQKPPEVVVGIAGTVLYQGPLTEKSTFVFDQTLSTGPHQLSVVYHNKTNEDCCIDKGLDQAVKICGLEFFDISDDHFLDISRYRPDYPEPWATEQMVQGANLPDCVTGCRYLGWNGTWSLSFSVPIFTWIHHTLHLGHIYQGSG